jgi:excisionase family DNA binding protein
MEHWMNTKKAANYIGVHPDTLRRWRQNRQGPSYVKFGDSSSRQVRYRKDVVDAWIERNEVSTT